MKRAEREAKEKFLEPVLKTIDPFLRLLFPGARLALDEETLEITGIARDGREEPYSALSIGTREQLSILVRLAFAVYLREKGYPAAVILDDALVYADDDRFERMQLALRKAAETVQILILTCRPRDWRQFGAPIRRLADVTTARSSLPEGQTRLFRGRLKRFGFMRLTLGSNIGALRHRKRVLLATCSGLFDGTPQNILISHPTRDYLYHSIVWQE